MRVRLLRGADDNTVLLVYPATRDEHCRVLDTVGCPGGSQGRSRPAGGAYVVTTAAQRERWGLADLAASGRVRVVDEAPALGRLCDGAAGLGAAEAPLAGAAAEVPPPADGRSVASALESVRALAAPGARLEQVLDALEAAELPRPASETLRRSVRALGSDAAAVDEALDRAEMVLALPWRTREPERFDPAHVAQALDRTHGGLERVKTRLLQVLAACPQTRGPLTVEGVRRNRGAETDRPPALVVRPGPARTPTPVPCLAGPSGTGKTSLAVAVAEALGRTHVRVPLGKGNAECLIRGVENGVTGRIVEGLHEAGVGNPVFILEELDRVASDAADALLDVLDPARRSAFRDEYLQVPFDLSAALWVVTATDAGGIPEPVRTRLEVIELPAYSEQEKLAIAQRYLLTRPFGQSQDTPPLALDPAAPARAVASDTARAGPAVVVDREVSSVRELEALWAAPPPQGTVEPWRTAACMGDVRFEAEAIRRVIQSHTNEAGVADLQAKLAAICRQVARRRRPGGLGPEVVTPATVRELLGEGEALPSAVRETWDLAGILGALCAKVVRRRAEGHGHDEHQGNEEEHAESEEEHGEEHGEHGEHGEHDEHQGNEAPVEVTPETVVEMLGAPAHPDEEVAGRTARDRADRARRLRRRAGESAGEGLRLVGCGLYHRRQSRVELPLSDGPRTGRNQHRQRGGRVKARTPAPSSWSG